ncbi:Toll-Interleukin-Resistance (TIR) domain family protein [Arabidopsis thaliana]|uniref:Toll-Interleukin-Resistance (TIR) domain family protein n=1 Tax=Arabidopsis thaliana TaxID=3702 RepID=F4JNL2_ARATH|nr:Toll-Interleukin-Resistance (TIR) domain family protein [Arabidopsis thaliana]AEE84770.2 Toll-Interleukin-Resistance (TIR) domain family protein [Arabidopsis thaliana]|eukprot:NP_001320049.1 Toll-Interleukin-Resistance (TIR) domain family protein [Arabidopsis thaliana]
MGITHYNKDQVFISFRGKDERNGLLTLLKQKLIDGNVNVFTDDKLTGQPLQNLFGHIRKSRIAIVIFSKNYAESGWCLDELVEIKKCFETEALKAVIPIFHRVKVSSVKKQSGKFGEKFLALQNYLLAEEVDKKKIKRINSRIKRWKKALKIVTEIAGLTHDKNSPELAFVEKVVEKIIRHLASIAAEEGRNSTLETSETPPVIQPNQIIYNVINIRLHRSKSLENFKLSYNPEEDNKSYDLKPSSPTLTRSASNLDHRDQYGPFPFEALMVKKQNENQRSIANIVLKKTKTWHNLHFVSALLFGALFVSYMVRSKK